ncbi:SGNH/GDSL hydrolase family protein [Butyrivibrio sp. X503]|uniref:SGNH/GDSL hydrolase family protein n=1 Tax=Butyrivibrio sp. X503 TaxID=2364878 RepID=UPI001314BE22|nr:SGNH/GDSL hydrolase family protein [Butyrivibrio sp. X503]
MKNIYRKAFLAMLSLSFMLTACSSQAKGSDTAEEYVNENTLATAEQSDAAAEDGSIVVAENLIQPTLEQGAASASTSTVTQEAPAEEAPAEEAPAEPEKKEDDRCVMVFIGDSQMENGLSERTDIAHLVAERVPHAKVYNLGIGGTTACVEMSTSDTDLDNWDSASFNGICYGLAGKIDVDGVFANREDVRHAIKEINSDKVDYYFIEYGANDFFQKMPLDNTQHDGNDLHTYYGGLERGINTLKEISPQAKIVVMTPFYGIYTDGNGKYLGDSYIVSNGVDTLANYARKALNVADDLDVIDFDAMNNKPFDLYLDTADEYLMDGTHLTLKGRQVVARLLAHIPNFYEGNEPYDYLEKDYVKIAEFDPEDYFRVPDSQLAEDYPEQYERLKNGDYEWARQHGAGSDE